jgi:hypothetical protein
LIWEGTWRDFVSLPSIMWTSFPDKKKTVFPFAQEPLFGIAEGAAFAEKVVKESYIFCDSDPSKVDLAEVDVVGGADGQPAFFG